MTLDITQRRLDILETVGKLEEASALQIAQRSGYEEREVRKVLQGLWTDGAIRCVTSAKGSRWRRA